MTTQAQQAEREDQAGQPVAISRQDALKRFDWLPCRLSLEIPVGEFTLGDLLRLQKGSVVATTIRSTDEVPLNANQRLIAWIQFEMLGDRLAARITELA